MHLAQLQRKVERLERAAVVREVGTEIAFAIVGADKQVKRTVRVPSEDGATGPRRLIVIEIPEALEFLVTTPSRYKVGVGGRCGAKTTNFGRALLGIADSRKVTIVCAREFQNSLADSVYQLLVDEIDSLGLTRFKVNKTTIVNTVTGSRFRFVGLRRNPKSLKGFQGADICWVEEAENVSEESWKILIPTFRKPGSEIWVSFNPDQKTDPTYKRFVADPPKGTDEKGNPWCIVRKINWTDNPWCSEVSKREARDLARKDPDAYMHVWEGEPWTRSDAQVLHGKWTIEDFEPVTGLNGPEAKDNWNGPYFGSDWGFAVDPTTLIKGWIHERTLYIEHEAVKVGCEISDTPTLFDTIPDSRRYRIYADRSRPETISAMRKAGFRITRCIDWPNSVEEGIAFIRSFDRIVIHPRCKETILEARLYSYKTDRLSGDVLPEVVDAHNHCLAAGTMVETEHGPVAIESLVCKQGALLAPSSSGVGRRKFRDVRMTSKKEETWKMILSDGRSVTATAEHVFLTPDGWRPLLGINPGDRVLDVSDAVRYAYEKCRPNSSLSKGSGSVATSAPATTSTRPCASECTGTSGKGRAERFPRDTTSTTSTGTGQTILSKTSPLCERGSITGITGNLTVNDGRERSGKTSARHAKPQKLGMDLRKGLPGTESTPSRAQQDEKQSQQRANSVGKSSQARSRVDFARTIASQLGDDSRASITFRGNALCVGRRSSAIDTQIRRLVDGPARTWLEVVAVEPQGQAPVYNLEVPRGHVFVVAGGVVTHNCWDAIRYFLGPIIRRNSKSVRQHSMRGRNGRKRAAA